MITDMTGKRGAKASSALLVLVVLLSLAAAGCGGLSRPAVTKRYYDIRPERPEQVAAAQVVSAKDQVLVVRRLRVSPMNSGRELLYRTSDTGFSSDFYHAYFVPPADMLSQALRDWLHRSGIFSHVLEPASLLRGDFVLEGNVVSLYGDYAGEPVAVAAMQFLLLNEGAVQPEVLFSADYEERVPLKGPDPGLLAAGLKSAVATIFAQLEADLAALTP